MVCAPVRSIIPSLKLGDYLSVLAYYCVKVSCSLAAEQTMDVRSPPHHEHLFVAHKRRDVFNIDIFIVFFFVVFFTSIYCLLLFYLLSVFEILCSV